MFRKYLAVSIASVFVSYSSVSVADVLLPSIKTYAFTVQSSKVAPGTSTQIASDEASGDSCDGNIDDVDTLGSLNVYAAFYQNGCYSGGGYANSNYPIEMGKLTSGTSSYTAYRVAPAKVKASEFLASHHRLRMKFDAQTDYDIYSYVNNVFAKTCHIASNEITVGKFTESSCLADLDALTKPTIYFAIKSTDPKPSTLKTLSPGVAGAKLKVLTGFADMNYYTIQQPDSRTPNDLLDSAEAPGEFHFAGMLHYNLMVLPQDKLGMVWQDRNAYKVYLTTLTADRMTTTITLPRPTLATSSGKNYVLGSAAADELGNLYYVLIQAGNLDPNYNEDSNPTKTLSVVAMKVGAAGNILVQRELNGSGNPLQVTSYGDILSVTNTFNMCSVQVTGSEVGVMLSRQYPRGSDGLNHQGAHAYVLNRDTLAMKKSWGQTAGHSMGHILAKSVDGLKFTALELGDNFDRGVLLHRFTSARKDSRVVYTFKTAHEQEPKELSDGSETPFYQYDDEDNATYEWSNDNRVYTELAGLVEDGAGYSVLFTSEHDSNGRVLNNASAIKGLNDPRNIGFIKVRPDFQSSTNSGTVVPDNLVKTSNSTMPETGEYYAYNGSLRAQRVAGVKWLTNYTDKAINASRAKGLALPNGNTLVLWEEWSESEYLNTKMMVINPQGGIVTSTKVLGSQLRLHRIDKLLVKGNAVWAVSGNKTTHQLELIEFKLY